jgi:hypothetical protein
MRQAGGAAEVAICDALAAIQGKTAAWGTNNEPNKGT